MADTGKGPVRKVLVATDLQATSREVVAVAARIARTAGARLLIHHVVETPDSMRIPKSLRKTLAERQVDQARRGLEAQAAEIAATGLEIETRCTEGGPAHRKLLERARDAGADLIVIGSHARGGKGHRLGSTADRLLRTTPVPCLVVRGDATFPARRPAVVTDFSRGARGALGVAAAWSGVLAEEGARLEILHVAERSYRLLDSSLETFLSGRLDEEVEFAVAGTGLDRASLATRLGWASHPVEGILEAAAAEGYDLLVSGTHGHGPLRRALVGSVAMGLAQSAACPVLIVPRSDDG